MLTDQKRNGLLLGFFRFGCTLLVIKLATTQLVRKHLKFLTNNAPRKRKKKLYKYLTNSFQLYFQFCYYMSTFNHENMKVVT